MYIQSADSEINFRNISFASSMDEIKALESKSDDTLDNPDDSSSVDGYTYLTYSFNGWHMSLKLAQPFKCWHMFNGDQLVW